MYDKMYALTKNGYTFIKHANDRWLGAGVPV